MRGRGTNRLAKLTLGWAREQPRVWGSHLIKEIPGSVQREFVKKKKWRHMFKKGRTNLAVFSFQVKKQGITGKKKGSGQRRRRGVEKRRGG